MTPKKVLFVLTSHSIKGSTGEATGFYLSEAAHPWKVLHEAGYTIDFVSPKGGKAPVDGFNLEDPINKEFWENPACQAAINNTLVPKQVQVEDYAAIHYVGGHGTMWDFPDHEGLAGLAAAIYEQGGLVSAVCHGPAGLVNIKLTDGSYLVAGKTVSGFTNEEEEAVGLTDVVPFLLEDVLIERGATFEKVDNWQVKVSVDQRLITGQNPASATAVGQALKEQLELVVAN
ncbi:MAG: type 1 glutamine amidotransferase domain-containing protein [Aureispira sp.]